MRHYGTYNYYDYGSSYFDSIMWGIVMLVTIALIVWAIFSLGSYILRGIGMYTIAKRLGIDYAWLAFVPFARTYLHGSLAGTILLKKKSIQNPGVWLLALPFIYGAVYSILYAILWFAGFGALMEIDSYSYYSAGISTGNIMGILVIFIILMIFVLIYAAAYKSLQVLVNHQILERFTSKNMSIVHGLLCTFIPLYESICFFAMRNRPFNPGMEPPTPTPFMQSPPPGTYYNPSGQGSYGSYSGTSSNTDGYNSSYNNFSGNSAAPGTNSYNNFNGTSSVPDPNGYNSFGGNSSAPDPNGYNSFGGNSSASDPNRYSNFGGQPVQPSQPAQTGMGYNSYIMPSALQEDAAENDTAKETEAVPTEDKPAENKPVENKSDENKPVESD